MRSLPFMLLCGLIVLQGLAKAAYIPQARRSTTPAQPVRSASMFGTSKLINTNDFLYAINITLNGKPYTVIIDTGSSDFWVSGEKPPNAIDSGQSASIEYAKGAASGPIMFAELKFAGYTVKNQTFFFANQSDTSALPGPGLLGLGPFLSSVITGVRTGKGSELLGLPPMDEIYKQNETSPNFFTVLLGRSADPDNPFPGELTIMDILPGYEEIKNQPKLEVQDVASGLQLWTILLDEDGVIGADGKAIKTKTTVKNTKRDKACNTNQLSAMFDTGFTFPQVPPEVAEGFYSSIEGAKLENISSEQMWTMPCDKEVNIAFMMGGKKIPIHPLDATLPFSDGVDPSRKDCFGSFRPVFGDAVDPNRDMILGMAFLRNTYFLINVGDDFADELPHKFKGEEVLDGKYNKEGPFLQLLPTSLDAAELHSDFQKARLGGTNEGTAASARGEAASKKNEHKENSRDIKYEEYTLMEAVLIGCIVGGVALVLIVVLCFTCRRTENSIRLSVPVWSSRSDEYQPLDESTPLSAARVHNVPYVQPQLVDRPIPIQYQADWKSRHQHCCS